MNQKPKITLLSLQWRQWIQDNVARGCTVDSMIDAMALQNFDRAAAAGFIRQVATASLAEANSANSTSADVHAPIASAASDSTYVYETPRLAQSGNLIKTPDRDVRVSLRMTKPVVAVFDNILSPEECDELIRRFQEYVGEFSLLTFIPIHLLHAKKSAVEPERLLEVGGAEVDAAGVGDPRAGVVAGTVGRGHGNSFVVGQRLLTV